MTSASTPFARNFNHSFDRGSAALISRSGETAVQEARKLASAVV